MPEQNGECDDLITRCLKERIHIILVLVIGTSAEICPDNGLVDRLYFSTVKEFLRKDRLFDCLWQNLLTNEIDTRHINFHK